MSERPGPEPETNGIDYFLEIIEVHADSLPPVAALALQGLRRAQERQQQEVARLKEENRILREHALVDELTELPNRRAFMTDLQAIAHGLQEPPAAERRESEATPDILLSIADADNFKLINDVLGYTQGDRTLRMVSQLLNASVRAGDRVYRLGGDEFVILAPVTRGKAHAAGGIIIDRFNQLLTEGRRLGGRSSAFTDDLGTTPVDLEALRVIEVSFGLGELKPGDSFETCLERYESTMTAMKVAKEQQNRSR